MVIGFLLCLFFFSLVFFFYYTVDLFFFLLLFFGIVFIFVSIFQFFLRSFVVDWFIVVMFAVFFTLIFFFFANYFLYFIMFLSSQFLVFAWISGFIDGFCYFDLLDPAVTLDCWKFVELGIASYTPERGTFGEGFSGIRVFDGSSFRAYLNSSLCADVLVNLFFFEKGIGVNEICGVLFYLEIMVDFWYQDLIINQILYYTTEYGFFLVDSAGVLEKEVWGRLVFFFKKVVEVKQCFSVVFSKKQLSDLFFNPFLIFFFSDLSNYNFYYLRNKFFFNFFRFFYMVKFSKNLRFFRFFSFFCTTGFWSFNKYALLKSPHVNKKAQNHFEIVKKSTVFSFFLNKLALNSFILRSFLKIVFLFFNTCSFIIPKYVLGLKKCRVFLFFF